MEFLPPLEGTMMASFACFRCRTRLPLRLGRAIAFVLSFGVLNTSSQGEGFRIETKIYVGDEEEPQGESTTLFLDGVVYDFLARPAQTAVFRRSSGGKPGRFILLSNEHRLRTEISTDKLSGAMEKLKEWAGRQRDPFLQFAANPEFEESFERGSGQLVLASHLENYWVTTAPADDPQSLDEYRQYLDWYTRLNALLSAGPPPEPRLRLNEALARRKAVPLTVELTRAGEKEPLRAEHDFTWRLSQDDMQKIEEVRASLASYRAVSNEEFLRSTRPPQEND
jgi:hypothetical protein